MKCTEVNILELIPQRAPMVMIDRLVFCEDAKAKAVFNVLDDNVFIINGVLSESGMLEAIAQTAAARTGFLLQSKSEAGPETNPVGVIGSIKDFRLFFYPKIGDEIEMEIEVIHEFINASVVRGRVKVLGNITCEAEMKIFLTGNEPH